jgi:3,4-dihydroxy 2-butanone 4-phosphate synthase/GTP cyclohydrolase II
VVERVPLPVHLTEQNTAYLLTKRDRMGHDLPGLPDLPDLGPPTETVHEGRAT